MTSEYAHRAATGRQSADPFVVGPQLLAAGTGAGPLAGRTFAVKGTFARAAADLRDAWYALRDHASAGASWPAARPVTEFVVLTELTDLLDSAPGPGSRPRSGPWRPRDERASFAARFVDWLGTGRYLVQPAAAGTAPLIASDEAEGLRLRTLGLTAAAGLSGAPALSLPLARSAEPPLARSAELPLGVCVVGRPGDDDALADLAVLAMPGVP